MSPVIPTLVVRENWGRLQVVVDGQDMTFFRDIPCIVPRWEGAEPFGDSVAVVTFPQITEYEVLGAGALSWIYGGAHVSIYLRRAVTNQRITLWEGQIASTEGHTDEARSSLDLQCQGVLYQADWGVRPPAFDMPPTDIGKAISDTLGGYVGREYAPCSPTITGIYTRSRGSWSTRLTGYIQDLLATATTADGLDQWTLTQRDRVPSLYFKDRTTAHASFTIGQPGIRTDLMQDLTTIPNVIYGEGTDLSGRHWRNARFPTAPAVPFFAPLASDPRVEPRLYDAAGNDTGPNGAYDPSVPRIERYENFGEGITRTEAAESAAGEIAMSLAPGWRGTITFAADPEEMSRFELRAGMNIVAKQHRGVDRWLHVAHHAVDWPGGTVTCEVDEKRRDTVTLAGLKSRNRDAAQDPARRGSVGRRRSRAAQDAISVFDAESTAGIVPAFSLAGGQWSVVKIPAGQVGDIARTVFATAPDAPFALGVFAAAVTPAHLASLVGNPLASSRPWTANADALLDAGMLESWGSEDEPCGYWPGAKSEGDPLTGRFEDHANWRYESDEPPWLWIAAYASASCSISGRMYDAVDA